MEIVDSIEALLAKVDVVLLESVDGRPHLAQATPVLKAGKPVFIDKPLAASLEDARKIVDSGEIDRHADVHHVVGAVRRRRSQDARHRLDWEGHAGAGQLPAEHHRAPSRPLLLRHPRRRGALFGDGHRLRPADAQGVGRQRRHDLHVEGRAGRRLQRAAEGGCQAAGADVDRRHGDGEHHQQHQLRRARSRRSPSSSTPADRRWPSPRRSRSSRS